MDFSARRWKKSRTSVSRTGEQAKNEISGDKVGIHLLELESEAGHQV